MAAEGIRAPNLPLGTNPAEIIGLEITGSSRSLKRFLKSSLTGSIDARVTQLEQAAATSGYMRTYPSRAQMLADTLAPEHTLAQVRGDSTPANNGIYEKTETSWNRIADLPDSIIGLEVTGGTANAIEVSASPQVPATPQNKLYIFEPNANNTDDVTIAVAGQPPVAIKSMFGVDLTENALVAGAPVLMTYVDGIYRLLLPSPVEADSVLADVLAAKDAAAASESAAAASANALGNQVHQYDTRALAADATIPSDVKTIRIYRYAEGLPLCETPYVQGTEDGPGALLIGSTWWNIDVSQGRVNLLSFGAPLDPGDNSTDATPHLTAALAPGRTVAVPKGLYVFSQILPPEGSTIEFAGRDSVTIRQKPAASGGNNNLQIFKVVKSDVRLLGGFTAIGNIAEDTGEWNHVVTIGDPDDSTTSYAIQNVSICDIHGIDIRGEVVYVGGTNHLSVTNVEIGHISGDNILRSIFAVTGGSQGRVKSVTGGKYSLFGVDFEPNGAMSQTVTDWTVEYARVGSVALLGASDNPVGRIRFETLVVDSSIQVESVPQYPNGAGGFFFDKTTGVKLANFQSLSIGTLVAKAKAKSAVSSSAGLNGDLTIGEYVGTGNGTVDPTQGEFVVEGCKSFTVERLGTVTLPVNAGSILVSAGGATKVSLSHGEVYNGRVINRGGEFCEFHQLYIQPNATSTGASFGNLDYPLWDRVQTVGTRNPFSHICRFGTLLSSNIQASTFSDSSNLQHTAISSLVLGTFYASKDLST